MWLAKKSSEQPSEVYVLYTLQVPVNYDPMLTEGRYVRFTELSGGYDQVFVLPRPPDVKEGSAFCFNLRFHPLAAAGDTIVSGMEVWV